MSLFVIPDESAWAGEIGNPEKGQYNHILSGSRLASRFAGLGRDDELRHSLLRGEGTYCYRAELLRGALNSLHLRIRDGPQLAKQLPSVHPETTPCHSERSEGSQRIQYNEILRRSSPQNDRPKSGFRMDTC